MKRKLLSALFIGIIGVFMLGAVSISAATYGKLTYEIIDGKVTITDCDTSASGELVIPSTIKGYPVTTIGDRAFYGCKSLTSVTIGDSVTTIGDRAFYDCDSLASITIPDSVTTIGRYAFYSCDSLTSITIPDSVTTIGDSAFYGCSSLASVTIPDSVTTIGDSAFSCCKSLASVTIPDSVTTIGEYAFSRCSSLTSIEVDNGNENYLSLDGNLYNKDKTTLIQYAIGKTATHFEIPAGVTTIGRYAFYGCDSLTSITIPDSVTAIGEYAFSSCISLESVTIPDSVTTIGDDAFSWCYSLTSITIPDSVTTIGDSAFYSCDSLGDVYYRGTEAEWEQVSIGSYNESLTNATIHYAITDTELSDDGKTVTVTSAGIENGDTVIVSFFDGDRMVEAQASVYKGETLRFTTSKTFTGAKIMVWDSLLGLTSDSTPETIR